MAILSGDDQRNLSGLSYLRGRYIARARSLLNARNREFSGTIELSRSRWNEAFPRYRVKLVPAPDAISISEELFDEKMLWPEPLHSQHLDSLLHFRFGMRLREEQEAHTEWRHGVMQLALRFWPDSYFLNPFARDFSHPAAGFVSACILHLSKTTTVDPDSIDNLFPSFAIEPQSLPYPPSGLLGWTETAFIQGERDFYRSMVAELLSGDPDRFSKVEWEAVQAGRGNVGKEFPEGAVPSDFRNWWWYVPVYPGMSGADIRAAAATIEERARYLSGDTPINDLILDLRVQGASHAKIAHTLGISQRSVTKCLRAHREK